MSRKPRESYRWRILCHGRDRSGSWSEGNHVTERAVHPHHQRDLVPEATEFDELVVGNWLHIEEQDTRTWWMNIGGVVVWVTTHEDGKSKTVTVHAPGDYDMPVDGCEYSGAVDIGQPASHATQGDSDA